MATIFISYRRKDTLDVCGRIYDRLEMAFGTQQVMMEVDSIPPGVDFRQYLAEMIDKCDVFLVVIGPRWLGQVTDTYRRIDAPNDFVRTEVELALRRGVPVIPVLVSGALMPDPSVLPGSLISLAYRNALVVRPNPDFRRDMGRLISGIQAYAGIRVPKLNARGGALNQAAATQVSPGVRLGAIIRAVFPLDSPETLATRALIFGWLSFAFFLLAAIPAFVYANAAIIAARNGPASPQVADRAKIGIALAFCACLAWVVLDISLSSLH